MARVSGLNPLGLCVCLIVCLFNYDVFSGFHPELLARRLLPKLREGEEPKLEASDEEEDDQSQEDQGAPEMEGREGE